MWKKRPGMISARRKAPIASVAIEASVTISRSDIGFKGKMSDCEETFHLYYYSTKWFASIEMNSK